MDPKSQFEARYKTYIEKRNLTLNQAHIKEAQDIVQGGSNGPKIKLGYAVFALLALAIPSTFLLLQQPQDIRQRASAPETIPQGAIKQVGSSYITTSDVDLRLLQLYGTGSAKFKDNLNVRQIILGQLIRERIIQQETSKQNITATDKEINDKAIALGLTPPLDRTKILNMVLEEKLKDKVATNRVVDYAFIFRNTTTPDYNINVARINKSYGLIKSSASSGKTIKQAFDEVKNTAGFEKAITITEGRRVSMSDFDKNTASKIFSLKKNEISDVIDTGGGVFFLIKILDSNNTNYTTFEDWYKAAQQTYIK